MTFVTTGHRGLTHGIWRTPEDRTSVACPSLHLSRS